MLHTALTLLHPRSAASHMVLATFETIGRALARTALRPVVTLLMPDRWPPVLVALDHRPGMVLMTGHKADSKCRC